MKAFYPSPSFWLVIARLMRLLLVSSSITLCRLLSCWRLPRVMPITSWSSEFPPPPSEYKYAAWSLYDVQNKS